LLLILIQREIRQQSMALKTISFDQHIVDRSSESISVHLTGYTLAISTPNLRESAILPSAKGIMIDDSKSGSYIPL
jgi:hypothetical protein